MDAIYDLPELLYNTIQQTGRLGFLPVDSLAMHLDNGKSGYQMIRNKLKNPLRIDSYSVLVDVNRDVSMTFQRHVTLKTLCLNTDNAMVTLMVTADLQN